MSKLFDIKQFRADNTLTQKELATILSCEQSYISNVESGRKKLSNENIEILSSKYGDITNYIINKMIKTEGTTALINHEGKGVPYYNVDFLCGFDLIENDQTTNPEYYINFKQYNNADFWINASGDSMRPIINSGDILALRQLPKDWLNHILYGEIYALVLQESRTIKKVRKSKIDGCIKLVPENLEEFDDQDILEETVLSAFQVLGCMKKLM